MKGENQAASPTSFLMGGSRPAPPGVKEENGDPIGVPQFGTYHGTICCIGMSQILYRRVVTSVSPLPKPREQRWSRFLESMPRVTRSTPIPTPPVETVPTVGTAPISASPLATPDPNPSRALASYVEPQSPRGPTVFHALSRGGWRGPRPLARVPRVWQQVATSVPPRPGVEPCPMALEAAEKRLRFGRVHPGRTVS